MSVKLELQFEGWTEEKILAGVAARVVDVLDARRGVDTIEAQIRTRIERAVDERVTHLTDEAIKNEVASILAEGWERTNEYGERTGAKIGLRERIGERINGRNRYDRESHLEKITKELLDAAIRKEFGEELTRLRAEFRAKVDAVLQAKLVETLRGALGL